MLYRDSKSKIRVNGYCSEFFKVERGVKQRNSLSSIFFAVKLYAKMNKFKEFNGNYNYNGIKWKYFFLLSQTRI